MRDFSSFSKMFPILLPYDLNVEMDFSEITSDLLA